MKSAEYQS